MPVSIYGLIDPRTDAVFYVGKTIQPLRLRLRQHIESSLRHAKRNAREQRIAEICAVGQRPSITLLEEVDGLDWRSAEYRWTRHYQQESEPLTNAMHQIGAGGTRAHVLVITPEIEARLGTVADAVLAEELGVTRKAVAYHREVRGIPASCDRTRNSPPPAGRKFEAIELPADIISKLGTMPDYKLAEMAGVSKKLITRRRNALGIKSYAERTGSTGQYKLGNFPARWRKRN